MSTKEYIQEHFPLLAKIDSPADLKKLDVEQLPAVCDELRKFIVHELSENPGHFASSMGAVEIAVALHYVFNTPDDRLVWDVGHQAYAHKILTGRRDRFSTNRKKDGLSGFPNPNESEYDTFQAGHASNSISAALGMSIASELLDNPERRVVAVIGDASISGGLAFEGINNASNHKNNLLIVLNDNDMSIDRPVGALGQYMTRLTASKRYNNMRYKTYQFMRKHHVIGDSGKGIVLRFNNAMKSMLTGRQNIFEGLNIRYFGPFDGHDVKRLVKTFSDIKDMTGPRLVHVRTIKGKGYEPAEKDPTTWHAPGKFDEDTGERIKGSSSGKPLKFQDVFGKTLVEMAKDDSKIVAITAAMPSGTSVSMMQEAYPARTFDVGISEGHAVTFAGGLAKEGLKPYVAIYSAFLQRAYDSIINDVSIACLPVTFCLDRAGLVGEDGVTHHGLFDLPFMRAIPGMIVSAPMDEHYLRNLMFTANNYNDGPFSIRYPRGTGKLVDWHNEPQMLPIGKGRNLRDGQDVAILSLGTIGTNVIEACESLHEQGIDVAHYDMIFLKPLDEEIMQEVTSRYRKIITIEDGTTTGGLGGAVAEWFTYHHVDAQLVRLGVPDTFVDQGTVKQLQEMCGLDAASIENKVKLLLKDIDK
ncbi:MAG: 1-deoxy-D-xylulose-5-phosphate synthase [Muribaculaceae bacterium]|nr:1-deoxy-D-xylulose-5-phosphate synthase [Muribaculaceae bacterium]